MSTDTQSNTTTNNKTTGTIIDAVTPFWGVNFKTAAVATAVLGTVAVIAYYVSTGSDPVEE